MTQHVDAKYGHVTIHDNRGHFATIIDKGPTCSVQAAPGWYPTDGWNPDQARELGSALIAWAARKKAEGQTA